MTRKKRTVLLVFALVTLIGSVATVQAIGSPAGGQHGSTDILEIETLLSGLGYWISKVDNKADSSTRHAIMAFQKVEEREKGPEQWARAMMKLSGLLTVLRRNFKPV